MILSPVGNLWAFTHDEFVLTDLEQMEKIKTLFVNKGNCYGDCVCVTKGLPIGDNNYKVLKFDEELNILNLDDCVVAVRNRLCLIGIKHPECRDIIYKTAKVVDELNSHLGG